MAGDGGPSPELLGGPGPAAEEQHREAGHGEGEEQPEHGGDAARERRASAKPVVRSPRAAMLEALTTAMRAAIDGGDLDAARVAHEAIGKLLATPPPAEHGAAVVSLASVRSKSPKR